MCEEKTTRLIRNVYYSWKNGDGLVQICLNGKWRFVCDDGWDKNSTEVFCKNLYQQYKGEECYVML